MEGHEKVLPLAFLLILDLVFICFNDNFQLVDMPHEDHTLTVRDLAILVLDLFYSPSSIYSYR